MYFVVEGTVGARMKSSAEDLSMGAFGTSDRADKLTFTKRGGLVGYLSCLTGTLPRVSLINNRSSKLCDSESHDRLHCCLLPKVCFGTPY